MKKRLLALLLAAAASLSLLGVSALAADGEEPESETAQIREETGEGEGPEEEESQDGGETPPEEEYIPDPVGTLTFENLERRMRENNLTLLALEENIQAIRVIDYDEMYEDLRQALNDIASAQWNLISNDVIGIGSMMAARLRSASITPR